MIIARGWITSPEKVVVTIQIQMPLEDLIKVRDVLSAQEYWPFGKLAEALAEVANKVEETAYTNIPDEAPK